MSNVRSYDADTGATFGQADSVGGQPILLSVSEANLCA